MKTLKPRHFKIITVLVSTICFIAMAVIPSNIQAGENSALRWPMPAPATTDVPNNVLKAEGGSTTLELGFGFDPSPIHSIYTGLRARMFRSATNAIRMGLDLSFNYQNGENIAQAFSVGIRVRPGFEKHLGNNRRVSPYAGVEGILGVDLNGGETVDGVDVHMEVGAAAVFGFDVYIVKLFYMGLETSLALLVNLDDSFKQVDLNLGFNPVPSIRIGWNIDKN